MKPAEALAALGIRTATATFEDYVDEWMKLAEISKALVAKEMEMRRQIAAVFLNPTEGTNTKELADGRKLKYTHKISRSIDESQISLARSEFELANERPVDFDDLLKVKHELVTSAFRKLEAGSAAEKAVARMVTSKVSAPTLEVR